MATDAEKIQAMLDTIATSITALNVEVDAQSAIIEAAKSRRDVLLDEQKSLYDVQGLLTKQLAGGTFRGIPLS